MNGLKPMLLMVVLGGILYVVYVVLNRGPAPEPPPGLSKDFAKLPEISYGPLPNDNGSGPSRWGPPNGAAAPGGMGSNGMRSNGGMSPSGFGSGPAASRGMGSPSATDTDRFSPSGSSAFAKSAGPSGQPSQFDSFGRTSSGPGSSSGGYAGRPDSSTANSLPGDSAATGTMLASNNVAVGPSATSKTFSATLEDAKILTKDHRLVEALQLLTMWYDNPKLTADESAQLNDWLGRLAGTVVYSREHLLEKEFVVGPSDRLQTIAEQYKVPWQLLAKINGISVNGNEPDKLVPGEKLKVLRGPFTAVVSLNRQEVALFVKKCYAGKFRIVRVGREAAKLNGTYEVNAKLLDPTFHPEAPSPTASLPVHHWVGFGDKLGLRGVADPSVLEDPRALDLDGRDAEDIFDILSNPGSRVWVGP